MPLSWKLSRSCLSLGKSLDFRLCPASRLLLYHLKNSNTMIRIAANPKIAPRVAPSIFNVCARELDDEPPTVGAAKEDALDEGLADDVGVSPFVSVVVDLTFKKDVAFIHPLLFSLNMHRGS